MCSIIAAVVGALAGGVMQHHQAQAQEDAAREAARAQEKAAKDAAARAPEASEQAASATAAVNANRRRIQGMQGMSSTATGAGNMYTAGTAPKTKLGT